MLAASCSVGFSGADGLSESLGALFSWLRQRFRRQQRSQGGFEFYTMYFINTGSGVQSLLPRETTGDVHIYPSLCVGNNRESDVC